jgi:transposase
MYKVKLTKKQLEKIGNLKKQETNKWIFRRLQCLVLSHQGKEYKEIANITGVCADTVTDWIKLYADKGLPGICQLDFRDKRQSKINEYIDRIKEDIKDNAISTLSELQSLLKKKYKIEIEESWLFRCCKKNSICLARRPV